MKKRLFLLMLMLLTGTQTVLYCADAGDGQEEVLFEPNIDLPLKGERIERDELPTAGYRGLRWCIGIYCVGAGVSVCLANRCVPSLGEQVPLQQWISNLAKWTGVFVGGSALSFAVGDKIGHKVHMIALQYERLFDKAVLGHNLAVCNAYESVIVRSVGGNRVLLMRRDNGALRSYSYLFDEYRQRRQKAINDLGLTDKIILGPENLRRIRAVNEKLDALENEFPKGQINIKPAKKRALH